MSGLLLMQMQINEGQNEEMEGRVAWFLLLKENMQTETPVQEQLQCRMNLEGFVDFMLTC